MNTRILPTLAALALAAAGAAQASEATQWNPQPAQKTRAEVKAELAEAVRTGDIASGHASVKLNELHPSRYPDRPAAVAGKTREEVRAELEQALRDGDVVRGASGSTLAELNPGRYPAAAVAGRSAEDLRASR